MKKYIKPSVSVCCMTECEAILAASGIQMDGDGASGKAWLNDGNATGDALAKDHGSSLWDLD